MPVTIFNGSSRVSSGNFSVGQQVTSTITTIVTTNLTHRFDAGDASSYAGSGTVWTNLNGTRNLAIVNTPTYVSSGQASRFIFDGVDDFMSGSGYLTGSAAKSHTVNMIGSFANLPTTFTRYRFFTSVGASPSYGMVQQGASLGPGEVRISEGTPNFNATVYSIGAGNQFLNQSQLAMFTFVSSNTGIDFYLNGSLIGGTITDTFVASSFTNAATNFSWGSDSAGTSPISMSIAHIMFYSGSLTPAEISQNYNALKSRYGI